MPPRIQSRFWRRLRAGLRGFRIATLLLILALLGAMIYLNRSGLPDFAKRPLLEKLRARGLDLELSRLRLRFYRGLVAEDVKFGRAQTVTGPRLTAKNVDLEINYRALLNGQVRVTAVVLDQGRLTWPITDTNRPPRELVVENIRANLRLLPGDEWALDHFHAAFAGADFTVSGSVTNASAIRDWPLFHGKQPAGVAQRRLRLLADALEKIHFATPPELRLVIGGDARDLQSFTARLILSAPDADTPWGKVTHGVFTARLFPASPTGLARAELGLQADEAKTPWADVGSLELDLHFSPPAGQTNVVNADLTAKAARVATPWADVGNLDLDLHFNSPASETNLVDADLTAKAARVATRWAGMTNAQFTAKWIHSLTNAIPLSGRGELRSATANTRWAGGKELHLTATLATPPNPPRGDASWGWWTNLQPFQLDWACELSQPDTEKLGADKVLCTGQWRAPELTITNLHADFPDGALDVRAQLDVATREARFEVTSDFDAHKISPMLTEKSARWLAKYTWDSPPKLTGSGAVTLPAWTNRQPDWRGEVLPTLRLNGEFAARQCAYLGVPADWARSHVTYSNMVWRLPDLEAGRPEGRLELAHIADDRTHDYYFRVHSTMDVRALRTLLATNQQRGLDLFAFSAPPVIDGEVWGRWREYDRIGFQGRVTLTNFSFREQTASHFESALRYTNRFLEFLEPRLLRGTQTVVAAGIAADFNTQRIYFTNAFSTAEPLVVARGIGPKTGRNLEPYRFTQPPAVRVNGYAPLQGSSDADLRFEVDGGPFEWWKFKLPHVAGEVHWLGETLELTNLHAAFYDGAAAGFAHFDFNAEPGTDFHFAAGVTNASLQSLMAGLSTRTNPPEGTLSGRLVITHANSADPRSWAGSGHARLRDGLLWEIPIFGVLSSALDAIMPGVGNSRVSEASARFAITNGVIAWDKLEMRSPAMRLEYDGTVDFASRVDMRVQAEPLRDAWVIGRVLNLALWPVTKLFQYQITGTLDHPKMEPVYVPKLLLMPLHPIRTLEDLFSSEPEKTNAPPVFKELP